MSKDVERRERLERAERLVWARKEAGLRGPQAVADRFGFNVNNYKAHEQGRNGFSASVGDTYADAFGVSRKWLYLNIGSPHDKDDEISGLLATEAPLVSWVSAGQLSSDSAVDEALGTAKAVLPPGDWIALRVEGESMDRISPPGSIIFVDRGDKRLVTGAFYVIDDGLGGTTYKRFQARPMRFEPVSKNKDLKALYPDNEPTIVGRVKLTTLDLT